MPQEPVPTIEDTTDETEGTPAREFELFDDKTEEVKLDEDHMTLAAIQRKTDD